MPTAAMHKRPDAGALAGAEVHRGPAVAPNVVGFVFQLELKRQSLGLGHGAFADLLQVDRSVWFELRRGDQRPSFALMKRVLTLWPGEFTTLLEEVILRHGDGGAT